MLEIDQQWGAARTLLGLANLSRVLGDLGAARGHYLAALGLLRQVKGDPEIARCLAGLGRIALDSGDLDEARGYLSRGLRLSLGTGSRTGISRSLLAFATLAVREARPDRAVLLAAAVTALSETAQLPQRPPAEEHHSLRESTHLPPRIAARVRRYLEAAAGLGDAEVARLWAAGLELTTSAAAEVALEPPAGPAAAEPAAPEPALSSGNGSAAARQPQAAVVPARQPGPGPVPGNGAGPAALTAREREVVALIARGASNKAIAQELFISPATAARHVANILGKLGYSSRSQVAAWAAAANSGRTGR
jgi:DNA-binding CsgD family transcriptional regulator